MNPTPVVAYVDDDLQNLESFRQILQPLYQMKSYLRPQDFLKTLEAESVDCYIFDFYMPQCDGFELLETVRRLPEKSTVPIFIITSNPSDEMRVKSYSAGAVDFIDRLITKEELLARLDSRIKIYKKNSPVTKLGNMRVDFHRMEVTLNEVAQVFTLLEYKILTCLLRRFPEKLSKNELVEHVWGANAMSDNNLNTHIYNLRKKIETWDFEICNHRTHGYWISRRATFA